MKNKGKKKTELITELRKEQGKEVRDIIKLKKAEQSLQESENRFRELFNHMSSGVVIYEAKDDGKDFIIKDFNRAGERIDKVKKEDIIGKSILNVFPGVKDFGLFKIFQEVYKSGKSQHFPISLYKDQRITGWRENYVYQIPSGEIVAIYDDITGRKQQEEKLQDSEEYLKMLFEYAPDAYYINDLKGNFIDGNLAAEKLTGYKKEELIGKSFIKFKILSLVDVPKAIALLSKSIRGLPTGPDEFVLNRKDNSEITVDISTYPVKSKGRILVLGIARDITERKQAEKDLAESEEKYRTVFENTGTATAIIEEDMTLSTVNAQCEELIGYSKEEIENKMKWTDFVLKEDLERMKKYHIVRREAGEKPPTNYEFGLKDKKGTIKSILLKIGMIPNTKKSVASLTDITELRQGEERIKHLNLVLRAIRNVNQLILKVKDHESLLKGICNSLTKTSGYYSSFIVLLDEEGKIDTYAEAGLGKDFLPMLKLLKKGKLTTFGQIALNQEEVAIIEDPASACTDCPLVQVCSARGSVMTVRLKHDEKIYGVMSVSIPSHFIADKEEQALFMETARDIAFGLYNIELNEESKRLEKALKESETKFRSIFDNATDGILLADLEKHKFYIANNAICQMLGYKQEEIVNLTTTDIHPREYLPYIMEQFEKQTRKEITLAKDIAMKRKDGSFFYADVNSKPITLTGKTYLLGIFRDITERKQSEERLKKTRDAALETMSKIIESKDPYTYGHQQRVSQLATRIAQEEKLPENKTEGIRIASLVHDIGKIGVPTEILSKPIKLSDIEFSLIKEHSQIGYDILKSNDFSHPVAQIVLQHHERLDGSGYPHHLKGDEIILEARILGVADVVEAMSSHRPYRPALGIDKALEEISQNKGILYDPEVVDICLKLFKEKGFKFE